VITGTFLLFVRAIVLFVHDDQADVLQR